MRIIFLIICMLSSNAFSEEQTFGSWRVDSLEYNGVIISFANTTNESGSTLGVMCTSDSSVCAPYLLNGLTCEEDGSYPALVGVDDGIASIKMSCVHIADNHMFVLPDEHLEYLISMNRYSVAFGVSGGRFKAAYFTLNGSAKAVIAARSLVNVERSNKGNKKKVNIYQDNYL